MMPINEMMPPVWRYWPVPRKRNHEDFYPQYDFTRLIPTNVFMATTTIQNVLDFYKQEGEVLDKILPFTNWVTAKYMLVLWMWLQTAGFSNLIGHIKDSDSTTVLRFVREAEAILQRLRLDSPPTVDCAGDIHCTAQMVTLTQPPINLHFFYTNRDTVVRGIINILDGASRLIFRDELRAAARTIAAGGAASVPVAARYALARPFVGGLESTPEDCRTMLITFTRDHSVAVGELVEYFVGRWGPCVERVTMESGQAPIHAWVVFHSPSLLPLVLHGTEDVQFNIAGKLLWARIYFQPTN